VTLDAHLGLRRGDFLLDVDLHVERGQVVALLGPNGSGKTTALHALAGLLPVERGNVTLDGLALDDPEHKVFVAPDARPSSLVFQDYLLFPHLSALDNVGFGLTARGTSRRDAHAAAQQWLERFGLADKASAKPRQLSGGQAQRVAIARALATSPSLLLLDEPLAALDAGTRATVRRDLRRHLVEFDGATVLVTHDPLDALALASHVVVLEAGRAVQAGPIAELTTMPRSQYVADLVGLNLYEGTGHDGMVAVAGRDQSLVVADGVDGEVYALVHPRAVAVHTAEPEGSPRNRWPATIAGLDLLGDRVRVRLDGPIPTTAEITAAAVAALELHEGRSVWVSIKATEIATYPR